MLVLFDLDDTLLDHRTAERAAARDLHARCGSAEPVDAFVSAWNVALERQFDRYLRGELSYQEQRRARMRDVLTPALPDDEADRLLEAYLEAYEAAIAPFPDAIPCLDRLAADGHRLGIISNGQTVQQRGKLALAGLLDRFPDPAIFISEACGCAKPDPAIFRQACAELRESPGDTFYVGDRYDVDAEGARRAGLQGVWLDRYGRAGASHAPPIVKSLVELPQIILACEQARAETARDAGPMLTSSSC